MELQALLAKANALPSIPKVVSEVLSELDADDPSPRKISQLVATDPALTARMLKLANSAFFNVTRQISSVDDAVGMLSAIVDDVENDKNAGRIRGHRRPAPMFHA